MTRYRLVAAVLAGVACVSFCAAGEWEPGKGMESRFMRRHTMMQGWGMGGGGMMGMGRGCPMCGMMRATSPAEELLDSRDELDLTSDQVDKLREMNVAFGMKQIDRRAEFAKGMLQVRATLDEEQVDVARLEKGLREMSDVAIEMIVARVETRQIAMKLLTDEQKKTFDTMMARRSIRGPAAMRERWEKKKTSGAAPAEEDGSAE